MENLLENIALVWRDWGLKLGQTRTDALLACAAFLAAVTIAAQAGTAVMNGDFETGASVPWTNGMGATPAPTAAAAHSGLYGLEVTGLGPPAFIQQDIKNQIIAGAVYHFTAWINLLEVSSMSDLPPLYIPHLRVAAANNPGGEVWAYATNATGLGWQKLEVSKSFTAQELQGAVTLEVGGYGRFQMDDVSGELLANWSFDTANGASWSYEPNGIWAPFLTPGEVDLHSNYTGSPVKILWQDFTTSIGNVAGATGTASMRVKSTSSWPTAGSISTKVYLDYVDISGNPNRVLLLAPDNSTVAAPPDGTLFSTNFTLPASVYLVTGFSVDRSGPGLFQAMDFHLNLVATPVVTITSPVEAESFVSGTTIPLMAEVDNSGGANVTSVEFYDNGTLIGQGQLSVFGEWAFPDDSHLSVMGNELAGGVDYNPPYESGESMYWMDGSFPSPDFFQGTFGHWNEALGDTEYGDVGIDFSFGSGNTLNANISGSSPLSVRNLVGGVNQSIPRYTLSWTNAAAGPHALTARAYYGTGSFVTSPPVNITIPTGGFVPEIVVQQPAGTDIADSGSQSFPDTNVGSNTSLTFTIQNTGSANLTGLTITKDGTNAPDFTVTANPLVSVIPGGSTTFTVQFAPSAAGTRTAAIHIASNDADENPYDITLTGLGVGIPEIAVQQPAGTNIADGGSKVFPNTTVGTNNSLVFTIRNTGTGNLTGLTITKNGTNASDFTITANPVAPVIAGAATTFTVRFAPTATGSRTAAIHIASNDADENPYDITLTGWGIGGTPEIAVQQPAGTNIADGGTKAFANTTVGTNRSLVFTIKNTGSGNLTGLTITKNGTNASDFTITANPVAPVIPGGTTTFTVRFAPTANGSKTAAIHIASNDADENPYDITLTGWGIGGIPEIAVQQPAGTNIADGGSKVFANTTVGTNRSLVFTIKNLGTANLTGLTITKNGANASDFTITANPVAPVIPGAATTFTVRFAPTTKGAKTAAIHIASNDANENPYDITLTGWGLAAAPGIADASENLSDLAAEKQSRDRSKTLTTIDPTTGLKYLMLEVAKAPGTERQRRIVEVSPNLLDWYSGGNHTTILQNNETFLKVRDNTPVTPGKKRYIRLQR